MPRGAGTNTPSTSASGKLSKSTMTNTHMPSNQTTIRIMKIKKCKDTITPLATLAIAGLLLTAGCLTHKPGLVLDPVGPPPGLSSGSETTGSLIVFSAFDPTGVHRMDRQAHTSYKILSEDGKLLQKVRNDSGNMAGGPTSVQLAAGSYHVVAGANGYGLVTVPVVVLGGKVTVVHLDGGGSWPDRAQMIQVGAVRLPDGRVVGWRATTENISNP
jgi:hypothetical protein